MPRMHDVPISPPDYLRQLGAAGEGPHDIARAGLMLAALDRPDADLAQYERHLQDLAEAAHGAGQCVPDAAAAAAGIVTVMAARGYDGDSVHYDDPQNADMIAVMDRRCGLPVALGILYLHAARAAGFEAQGLAAPGPFLLTVAFKRERVLIDPFHGGARRDHGFGAPPAFGDFGVAGAAPAFEPVSDTDVLLRLENAIKTRALAAGNAARATEIVSRMVMIAPSRAGLWLELAQLQETAGALGAARTAYEKCLAQTRAAGQHGNEAALALAALKRRLN